MRPSGRYRHYKGGEYDVVAYANSEASGEAMVCYRSVDEPDKIWTRPLSEFEGPRPGATGGARFERIGPAQPQDYRCSLSNEDLAKQAFLFSEYESLLKLELTDRSPDDVYALAFSRLLKRDLYREFKLAPDGDTQWPVMIGTDERDLFIPPARALIEDLPEADRILDLGCGDGQTTAHIATSFSPGAELFYLDPNRKYLEAYREMMVGRLGFRDGGEIATGIDTFVEDRQLGPQRAVNAVLAIHMIYFASDLTAFLNRILDLLAPGGAATLVFADEMEGYTGSMVESAFARYLPDQHAAFKARIAARHRLFGLMGEKTSAAHSQACLRNGLGREDFDVVVADYQASRLYGHDIGDMLAFGLITDLAFASEISIEDRIAHISDQLQSRPETYDLALETAGARARAISGSEPQVVVCLRKAR